MSWVVPPILHLSYTKVYNRCKLGVCIMCKIRGTTQLIKYQKSFSHLHPLRHRDSRLSALLSLLGVASDPHIVKVAP